VRAVRGNGAPGVDARAPPSPAEVAARQRVSDEWAPAAAEFILHVLQVDIQSAHRDRKHLDPPTW